MCKKEVLFAAVIGGVIGAVLVMAAGSIAPLGAQNDVKDVEFESITCRRIWVVDEDADLAVSINNGLIGKRGITVHGKDNNVGVEMHVSEYGGQFGVFGKGNVTPRVAIGVNEYGHGAVSTRDKNGYRLATLKDDPLSANLEWADIPKDVFGEIKCTGLTVLSPNGREAIRLTVDDLGGLVGIFGKDGLLAAGMGLDKDGGRVEVFAKDEKPRAFLDVDEFGGMIAAVGNHNKQSVGMYITEQGGLVKLNGKDGSKINLNFNEYGGHVGVIGHGGSVGILGKDMPKVLMRAGEDGSQINVMSIKGFYPQAIINVGEQAAQIKVVGQDENTSAGMLVDQSESYVLTWKDNTITGRLGGQ